MWKEGQGLQILLGDNQNLKKLDESHDNQKKSLEKITEQSFQVLIGGFRRSPTRRIIDMSSHKNFQENLEFAYKRKKFHKLII